MCEKRLLTLGYQKDGLGKLYLLPFKVTKVVKQLMFQFKVIHNILCTKSLLFKMRKEEYPHCPFCPADHTIIHLFRIFSLNVLKPLRFGRILLIGSCAFLIQDLSFQKMKSYLALCSALNHLVIVGKYFPHVNALSSKLYVFNEFVSLVSENIKIEKCIFFTSSCEKEFKTKWSVFSSFFNL